MSHLPVLVLLFCVYSCYTYSLKGEDGNEGPNWPEEYYLKGEELNLKTGLKTPFKIWSSKSLNRYRKDVFDGVEKKYYYGTWDDDNGTIYYIFPMSNEEEENDIMCVEMPTSRKAHIFLPNLTGAYYTGDTEFKDKTVQVWELEEDTEDSTTFKRKAYTYNVEGRDVPVQITTEEYNPDKGYLKSHVVTNYYNYESLIDQTDLDVEWEGADCDSEEVFWKEHGDFNKLDHNKQTHVDLAFSRFATQHNRLYDEDEQEMRKAIFHKNWKTVTEHNSKNLGYKLEMNKFADWTDEELSVLAGTRFTTPGKFGATPFPYSDLEVEDMAKELPDELDLRIEGVITAIKNQGNCGSCWAFATVAAVEGALARKNGGRDLDLSEQSVVDCAWGFDSAGCMGGTANGGLKYVLEHGLPTEEVYGTYMAKNGMCHVHNMSKLYHIEGFGQVTPRNPEAMKVALNKYGPVVVALHASDKMKLYSSGVFYDITCEDERANHAVTLVGYGLQDGDLYWIIKNSWGEDWGEVGYILLSAVNNNCLTMDTAFYPIA